LKTPLNTNQTSYRIWFCRWIYH